LVEADKEKDNGTRMTRIERMKTDQSSDRFWDLSVKISVIRVIRVPLPLVPNPE